MVPPSLNQECHICLEDLQQELAAVPCGHVFHHICIIQALQVNKQCPICRRCTSDADIIALYFDVPSSCTAPNGDLQKNRISPSSGDNVVLGSRVKTLMEHIERQNKHQERIAHELRHLRSQSEQLLHDKETLIQRIRVLEATRIELLTKVARYQIQVSHQAEAARRVILNQSIINYLNTCDASAIEENIQNPSEVIMALKKACKFRHDQFLKAVKEKTRLKEMLINAKAKSKERQTTENTRMVTSKSRKTNISTSESEFQCPHLDEQLVLESKRRKFDSSSQELPVSKRQRNDDCVEFEYLRSESVKFCEKAYSNVVSRPPPISRQIFGRCNFNPNRSDAFNLTPSSETSIQIVGDWAAVNRRGYDETGKLTKYSKEGDPRSETRKKLIPSMQHLLNAKQNNFVHGQRKTSSGQQEYALTNWLRNT